MKRSKEARGYAVDRSAVSSAELVKAAELVEVVLERLVWAAAGMVLEELEELREELGADFEDARPMPDGRIALALSTAASAAFEWFEAHGPEESAEVAGALLEALLDLGIDPREEADREPVRVSTIPGTAEIREGEK